MKISIQNRFISSSIELLYGMNLKGKQSRHRTRLIRKLGERLNEISEQESELAKEHCHLDEKGNPKTKNDGRNWDLKEKNKLDFHRDREELFDEEMVIEGGDNEEMLKTVKDVLLNSEESWKGISADTYDYLCSKFEEGSE